MNRKIIIVVFLFFAYFDIFAQSTRIFDLARNDTGSTITIDIEPCSSFILKIINSVPNINYFINSKKILNGIKPFKIGDDTSVLKMEYNKCDNAYKKWKTAIENLQNIFEERDVQNSILNLKKAENYFKKEGCEGNEYNTSELINIGEKLIKKTEFEYLNEYGIDRGEEMEITIEREDGRKWTVVYDAGKRGEWITTYGFAFASNCFLQSRVFGIRQISQDSSITIISQKSRMEGDFAPAIFFSWIPASRMNSNISISPCGGIGFDLKKPVILGGISITYNWNLSLIAGILFRWDKRISDQYVEFQTIKPTEVENINRETVVFNPFIALSYRFGANPFLENSESKKEK